MSLFLPMTCRCGPAASLGQISPAQCCGVGTSLWQTVNFAATPESVKSLAFDPSQKMAYYCKVQLVTQLKRREARSEFVDASREFLELLMPYLMRSLPDWRSLTAALESP